MSRDDIVLNFTANPDDGDETADIDEFLDVSLLHVYCTTAFYT